MQQPDDRRARFLKRLALAADIHRPHPIRLAAVKAVLAMLPSATRCAVKSRSDCSTG